jgi:hypothetical protein
VKSKVPRPRLISCGGIDGRPCTSQTGHVEPWFIRGKEPEQGRRTGGGNLIVVIMAPWRMLGTQQRLQDSAAWITFGVQRTGNMGLAKGEIR